MKKGVLKWAKKNHKWPALIISFFLILFVLSGMVMNHRNLFSKYSVNRKYLPEAYKLENWNLGSVRSGIQLDDGSRLLFGNSGIWKTDSLYTEFSDFNAGFPEGMDMRKVRVVRQTPGGNLLAGTFFGLYKFSQSGRAWERIELPLRNERIQDIVCLNNKVFVVSRSEILMFEDGQDFGNPGMITLKAPDGYDGKMSLFRFIWVMHSGEIAGMAGKLFLDVLGLVTLFLIVTGLIHFLFPKLLKKVKTQTSGHKAFRKKNLRLHNKVGAWFILFLIAVPLTGMFLRPPFLIPIANAKIPILPVNSLGKDNPWEDKLRSVVWSPELNRYIIATSDGFYHTDSAFKEPPVQFDYQPPVSVMGINVFEYAGDGRYFIGSFDGLFEWNPVSGEIYNLMQPDKPVNKSRSPGRPSANLISGMIVVNGHLVVFDYDHGASSNGGKFFPDMPKNMIDQSPMPLWNVAQEIHTGRIYQPILGPFYILIVPLVGLLTILVFITGYIRWRKIFRKIPDEQPPVTP